MNGLFVKYVKIHVIYKPTADTNKLLMQWKGPFAVIKRVANHDFAIDMNIKERIFHANLLKKYLTRHESEPETVHAAFCLSHISVAKKTKQL